MLEQDDGGLRVEAVDGPRQDLQTALLPRQGALADVVDRDLPPSVVKLTEGDEVWESH